MNATPHDSSEPTRADALHARLRARLFDGSFAPGEQVSIRRIAEAEGTSMIPARDALRGLVAEGALEFRGARSIVVPELSPATLDQIRYARIAIEGELAARAAPGLFDGAEALARLDRVVDAAIKDRDPGAYMAANRAFHFAIYRAAAAPVLLAHAELLWMRVGPSMRLICEGLGGHLPRIDQHRNALSALGRRDVPAFRSAIEADIRDGMAAITNRSHRGTAPQETEPSP